MSWLKVMFKDGCHGEETFFMAANVYLAMGNSHQPLMGDSG
jgi:hypothetical protein